MFGIAAILTTTADLEPLIGFALVLFLLRTGWRFYVFLPRKRSVVRLDAAREIDGKRKRMLTPSNIVLHLNIGDPARLFVTNEIQASIYPIHCNAILLAVGAI